MYITVLTTTYNRAYRLPELYGSLKRQTRKDFEWIIIDDGSTDETGSLVEAWKAEDNGFDIVYRYTPNGGKHRGLNLGISIAGGDAIINVDSDDYLADDAIEFIDSHFPEVYEEDEYAGIGCLMCDRGGSVVGGEPGFEDAYDADVYSFNTSVHPGDKVEVYKTDVLRNYPYPEHEGENFLPESAAIYKMSLDGLKMRWFRKVLTIVEYLSDGLSHNAFERMCDSPIGWAEYRTTLNRLGEKPGEGERKLWWLVMHEKLSKNVLYSALEISEDDNDEYEKNLIIFEKALSELAFDAFGGARSGAPIALYGYGRNGQFFEQYLRGRGLKVSYVIDRNATNINRDHVYSPEDDLPDADVVFLTLGGKNKEHLDEVQKLLKDKLPLSRQVVLANLGTSFFE